MFRSFFSPFRILCTLLVIAICSTPFAVDAFYASANEAVLIEEPIHQDTYIAGDTVRIIAPITADSYLAGGEVDILAPIDDGLYITGGSVFIDAPVSGDVFVFGGSVKLSRQASVGGSLVVAAGTVSLDAPVAGDAYIFSDQFHAASGSVAGNVYHNADIADAIELLPVAGKRVTSLGALRPEISDDQIFSFVAISSLFYFIIRYLGTLVLTLLTVFVFHRLVEDSATYLRNRYWSNFLYGVVILFFGWIAALFALPFSLSLSLWLFVSWLVFAVFLAKVFVSAYLTYITSRYLKITNKLARAGIAAIVVVVVLTFYFVTPINFLITLFLFAPLLASLTTIKGLVTLQYLRGKSKLNLK